MKTTRYDSNSRGHANHGWLDARHTFSFANYYNPSRMGFGALRVLNDDIIAPEMGFGLHPHKDMEIISIPLAGALAHKDSMGHEKVIRKGEVQVMSAGTGVVHSEYNHSHQDYVNLLQIWVLPRDINLTPRYDQKEFSLSERNNKWQLVVSPDGRDNSLMVNQDTFFSLAEIEEGEQLDYLSPMAELGLYVFIIDGEVEIAGEKLGKRDALSIEGSEKIAIKAKKKSEVLVINVPV